MTEPQPMTDERRAALQRIATAKAMCPDDVATLLADHARLKERVARIGADESSLPSLAYRLDELREALGLELSIEAWTAVERACERLRELARGDEQRATALRDENARLDTYDAWEDDEQ
jgi:hypothetical protein